MTGDVVVQVQAVAVDARGLMGYVVSARRQKVSLLGLFASWNAMPPAGSRKPAGQMCNPMDGNQAHHLAGRRDLTSVILQEDMARSTTAECSRNHH